MRALALIPALVLAACAPDEPAPAEPDPAAEAEAGTAAL
jgi:hypothetical protein